MDSNPPRYARRDEVTVTHRSVSASQRQDDSLSTHPVPVSFLQSSSPTLKTSYFSKILKKFDFRKSYTFKVNSYVYDEKLLRFGFKPSNGFDLLYATIIEKLHFNLKGDWVDESLAMAYIYEGDLIVIQSDEELLECINLNQIKKERSRVIELHVYHSKDQATCRKNCKKNHKKIVKQKGS